MKTAQAQEQSIKSFGQLVRQIRANNVPWMRMMMAFDFSVSNTWSGSNGRSLHDLSDLNRNPYVQVMNGIKGMVSRFVKNGQIPAYRFGCYQSEDFDCLPLCAPANSNAQFENFDALTAGYCSAVQTVKLYGPTQLAPVIQQAIKVSAETNHKELLLCVIITDGDSDDILFDAQALVEASKYPICFVGVGVGNGPFTDLEKFDDLKDRKFDNFQFVGFNEVISTIPSKCERPDLVFALAMFKELPAAVLKMRKAGILQ
ncbi:Copine_I [Hexamita inflata]|uniref:Copine I n=1 Tax=Hexamita inflata TaxID=28002 RepID=A0AA86QGN3_9EUKA|nr:Copine I [Hexamita inflata]CAI9920386.1 Copine I [Hexamita inflata]CAI9952903.1 Copine I [Hexamita inflata]CAI9952907.1 Copine I [Hexamita inflata]CAI9966657.1 Copine I [Hexamita inflata]